MSTMFTRLSAAALLCLGQTGCAGGNSPGYEATRSAEELEAEDENEEIEGLALSLDVLDVRHGRLVLEATMLDASADVSVRLGSDCVPREVGRGISTRSGFTWRLGAEEVSRAIPCGLVVRARAYGEDGARIRKIASLPVSIGLEVSAEAAVRQVRVDPAQRFTRISFATPARSSRLEVAGAIVGAEDAWTDDVSADAYAPLGLFVSTFSIDHDDWVRSVLEGRGAWIYGERLDTFINIGGLTFASSAFDERSEPGPSDSEGSEPESDDSATWVDENGEDDSEAS